ncbi:hypothetical protein RAZWK3B_12599 [Roseobacter sp. AzwK-3b]|nr:hypothetical protein RAZWK3B_12599 [Roseobacter sp. AzwK-3b]
MVGGAASAQDWNLDWGGYYNMDVLYNDASGNFLPAAVDVDGVNIHQNGEIHFTPSVTLDNGMTFGVVVEMEAANAGGGADGIDESYMFISSDSMGRVEVGSENSAGYKLSVGAPSVGFGINSPSPSAYHPTAFLFPDADPADATTIGEYIDALDGVDNPLLGGAGFALGRNAMGSSATEVAGNNDTARISYYTPSFNGLTLGVSYAPGNTNVANSGLVNRNGLSDIFDIGANYSQSFGNVDMTLSARWGTADAATARSTAAGTTGPGLDGVAGTADDVYAAAVVQQDDPTTWAIGAQFATAGFTFGGSYAENDAGSVNADGLKDGAGDSSGWSLGVTYDVAGPWTIGFDTYQGEMDGSLDFATGTRTKAEYVAYQIGAERSLGNGVAWRIYAIQSETSLKTNRIGGFANDTGGNSNVSKYKLESTTIGTGIRLTF